MIKRSIQLWSPTLLSLQQGCRVIVFVAVISMLTLIACRQTLIEEASPIPIPTGPAQPTENPPATTPTAAPQPTVTLPPTPTVEPSPTICPGQYFFTPAPPSCPAGEPQASAAAEQPFEGGVMIWLEAIDSIYVFYKDQRWQRFDDTWSEGQLTSDPAIAPPAERFQPVRGFGKVWRENPLVRQQLGWALGPELAYEALIQPSAAVEGATVIFLATFNGQVFALTNHGQNDGEWVIAAA